MKPASNLNIGYAEAVISPEPGISLGGYGFYLGRKAERILDDLKVRAIALESGSERALLVSVDLLGFTVDFSDGIRQAMARSWEIPAQNVLLACTHTHSSPQSQPLPGLGEMDPTYLQSVADQIVSTASAAIADRRPARASVTVQAVEPIGYNRTTGDFCAIDPHLRTLAFDRGTDQVYLLNYACHPVTLGPTGDVSADWPGALIRKLEERGERGIFFQGFCGNIDPVVNLNHWAGGTPEDIEFYGELLATRVLSPRRAPEPIDSALLRTIEQRISVPLRVPPREALATVAESFLEMNRHFPNADRFAKEWLQIAREHHPEASKHPFVDNVPLQVVRLGPVFLLAVPGEVFTQYAAQLPKEPTSHMFPLGYANGNIGYLPPRESFDDPSDYASHCAPLFYTVFPFDPSVEQVIVRELKGLLDQAAT